MKLKLKDSQYIKGEEKEDKHNMALYCQAVDILNKEIKEKKVDFFSLSNNKKKQSLDNKLIWYDIDNTRVSNSNVVVNKATFYTSHCIGFYSTKIADKPIDIIIKPRFGDGIFDYLLSYAYGIYLPKGTSATSDKKSNNLWLIAIMWKATLEKAMTKSQIPKEYQKFEKNLSTYKGQLNISKHIQYNLFDKSKFYCSYRKLTMDTTINQTIVYVYKLLEKIGYGNLLKDIAEYVKMLHSFGVQQNPITQRDIQHIQYTKLNIYYKKVMELSSLIIKSQSKSSDILSKNNDSFSYFLDIAELWENYLLKVLQKGLPQYDIYSPNEKGGISLFDDGSREIRPDIIIKNDGEVIAVLDAKYKWYNQIGEFADYNNSVSRDDLYQMSTYMYHYGKNDKKLIGLFVSPITQGEISLKSFNHNKNHKIGVLNLNIQKFDKEFNRDDVEKEEQNFIEQLKEILI